MKWYVKRNIFSFHNMHAFTFDLNNYDKVPVTKIEINSELSDVVHFKLINRFDKHFIDKIDHALDKMDFKPNFTTEQLKSRVDMGYFFTVSETDGGQIVGWTCAAVNEVFFDEFNSNITLKKNYAFSYSTYVHKHFRGNKLHHYMQEINFYNLKIKGFNCIWGLVHKWNKPSIKSFQNMKWDMIGDYKFLKFMYFNFHFPPDELK